MALPITLKTPGVYIDERSAFPNSVVGVETAVPAFVGYTEKAKFKGKSLLNKPVRIDSMMEFQNFYGNGPKTKYSMNVVSTPDSEPDIHLNNKGFNLNEVDQTNFKLFDAMKFFYQNGGGSCFVISVGTFENETVSPKFAKGPFSKGIKLLEKETVPTMLLIPDAMILSANDCYSLQQEMLMHCGNQMNRVAVLDIFEGFKEVGDPLSDPIVNFRNRVASDFLNYGAAYYPWLNTTVTSETEVNYENLDSDAIIELKSICKDFMSDLKQEQIKILSPCVNRLSGGPEIAAANASKTEIESRKTPIAAEITKQEGLITNNQAILDDEGANRADKQKAQKAIDEANKIAKDKKNELAAIEMELEEVEKDIAVASKEDDIEKQKTDVKTKNDAVSALTNASTKEEKEKAYADLNDSKSKLEALKKELALLPNNLSVSTIHSVLNNSIPDYKLLMEAVLKKKNLMAPASAMAGIYSLVDSQRGVWKAPANVAVSGVVSPAVLIDYEAQEDLNAPILGKAINAIRPFIGLGTMVWGARTLDANSLDWRYINVRRTMIMMEQSIKFAAKAYVFEPNVKNTWVSVQAMIANFLTNLWKLGALAGAVPADAFSVNVGLGTTMTAVDILEGKMIIEVKVAVSRPAEFIVITFEQQMQKS